MTTWNYDDFSDGDGDLGGTLAGVMNWSGAILSLLLILGLGVWGVQLWQRDVSGVPVVRALEGPMRIAPEDPGGVASEYQGLAVNRIAEERIEETTAERVVLAPAPIALDEVEDVPLAAMAEEAQPLVEVGPAPSFVTVAPPESETQPVEKAPSATDLAVAEALGALLGEERETQPVLTSAVVSSAPRPEMRPVRAMVQRVAAVAPSVAAEPGEIAVAAIPAGTRLVQLGAFASADEARAEWQKAEARFDDYMVGKSRVIQEVKSGGRTFYRLRAHGFDGLSDARRFCAILIAEGAGCIPVVQG
jgi:cell division septation protein DedD